MSHHHRRRKFHERKKHEAEERRLEELRVRRAAQAVGSASPPQPPYVHTPDAAGGTFDGFLDGLARMAEISNRNAAMNAAENLYRLQWLQMHGIMPAPQSRP
jgi:hypothetical protein